MSSDRDQLLQQLAAVILPSVEGGSDISALYDLTPLAVDAARAVLDSGLVVPAAAVLDLAQQWENAWGIDTSAHWRDSQDCAAELRALINPQETP